MPVWHDVWKTSGPLSDLDQWLNIAKRDPNVNAKLVVGVCNAQQRLVHPLPPGLHTRCPRRDARRGPSWPVVALREGLGNVCYTMTQTRI